MVSAVKKAVARHYIYMAPENVRYLGQTKPHKITITTLQVIDNGLYKP
jgi:hypothetical protein